MIGLNIATIDSAASILAERMLGPWRVRSYDSMGIGGMPVAGIRVTKDTALTYSTFFACIRLISETIRLMPFHVFRRAGRYRFRMSSGRDPKDVVRADGLLSKKANEEMGAATFREQRMIWAMLQGNSCSEIDYTLAGLPGALYPFDDATVDLERDSKGALVYVVKRGQEQEKTLPAWKVFHLRGPSPDGLWGWSIPKLAREPLALGLAMQSFGAAFFGNNCRPGLALKLSHKLKREQREKYREEIDGMHRGSPKAYRTLLLQPGMDLKEYKISADDAQFLESRKFQKAEVCQWFNMKLHKVGEPGEKFNNMERQNIEYIQDAILPWASRLEEEADMKLIGKDRAEYYTKLNANQFLRGDSQARGKWYDTMFKIGVYSINDILSREDENPVGPAGDMHFVPMNMASLDQAYRDGSTTPKKALPGGVSNGTASDTVACAYLKDGAGNWVTGTATSGPSPDWERYSAAHRCVFEAAAAWLVKKEANAATRAAAKHDNDTEAFSAWLVDFHERHADEMVSAFSTPADALAQLVTDGERSEESVTRVHEAIVSTCAAICAEAAAAYRHAYGNLGVPALAAQRAEDSAGYIADRMMASIIAALRGVL